jgi:hypothetical protein
MNPLGGPKVGWRVIMMYSCFVTNFPFMLVSLKTPFKSSSWNTCIACVEVYTQTTMLENILSNKIDNIMLFVGMVSPI